MGTLAIMVALNPVFAWLVSKLPRSRFIPLVYRFFASNLLVFAVIWPLLGSDGARETAGAAFYIWLSVFNLFAVSIFRQLMADCWRPEQAKRLFGLIGIGGTAGAVVASFAMTQLPGIEKALGLDHDQVVPWLFVLAALSLELCVFLLRRLERALLASAEAGGMSVSSKAQRRVGGDALAGARLLARSRFLQKIAAYPFLGALIGTLLYYWQAALVDQHTSDQAARASLFAWLNFSQQSLTLLVQIFGTQQVIRILGLGRTLLVLPVVTLLGIVGLMAWPVFGVLFVVQLLRRGLQFSIATPAVEALFTYVSREEKYKSKAVIDTVVKRGGDVGGSALQLYLLAGASTGLVGGVLLGAASLWVVLARFLGRDPTLDEDPGGPRTPAQEDVG